MKLSFLRILFVFFLYFTFTLAYSAQPIDVEKDGITYRLKPSSKTAEVISADKSLQIAKIESIDYENTQYSVNSIGKNAFYNCCQLTSVNIGNSVNYIGENAFMNCSQLVEMTIPSSVTYIGESAFQDCVNMTSVNIPNSVTSIGYYAFYNCKSLKSVTIPNSLTSIGSYTFQDCSSLTEVYLGDSVTSIGGAAFSGCSSLISLTIPNSVIAIGTGAFQNCTSLTKVIIGNSLTSIFEEVFMGCSSLTEVTIPNSVTAIGPHAFERCTSLKELNLGDSVTSIYGDAFNGCSSLIEVTIPNSVTSIDAYAFYGCSSLKKVNISDLDAWCKINFKANATANPLWQGKADLYLNGEIVDNLVIPNSIKTLGFASFINCSSIVSVKFPEGFENIGGGRNFQGCDNLERISLPCTLKTISGFSFYNCALLGYVECFAIEPPSLGSYSDYSYIDSYPFANSYPEYIELHVPKGCKEAYSIAKGWSYFTQIIDDLDITGIEDVLSDSVSLLTPSNIYNLQGICLKSNATEENIKALTPGLYIIGGKKVLVK